MTDLSAKLDEILACPFCDDAPEIRGPVITCQNTKCWGPSIWHMANAEDSIAAWNTRALAQQALRTTEAAQWFAVQSVSGAHVGMWQDRRIAERVFREEYPDGKFIPLYAQPPAEGVKVTDAMVELVAITWWGDYWPACVEEVKDNARANARRVLSALEHQP